MQKGKDYSPTVQLSFSGFGLNICGALETVHTAVEGDSLAFKTALPVCGLAEVSWKTEVGSTI